jgi:RES domain
MGAPPKRLAPHGRANPPGIPYLYLNSTISGAISELRPHTGELASVATFQLPITFKAVDLRDPRKLVSPFLLEDENQIGLLRLDIPFLERRRRARQLTTCQVNTFANS